MAEHSHIEWTDATWNPVTGCSVVSPGCTNCYAMKLAGTRLQHHPSRAGLTQETKAGPVWTGEVRLNEEWLDQPLRWRRGRRIFVCAHGDLFHEDVPDEWIDRVFAIMALCPQHTFQVLTKRAGRMRAYLSAARAHPVGIEALGVCIESRARDPRSRVGKGVKLQGDIAHLKVWPLPNVWLGVSVEDQQRADERIPNLLATPAAVRFLSCEPLLGPVDLTSVDLDGDSTMDALNPWSWEEEIANWRDSGESEWRDQFEDWYGKLPEGLTGPMHPTLDWVICGGESGPGARPMHPDWVRSLRDQCAEAGVPFFFKQWGAFAPNPRADCIGASSAYWPDGLIGAGTEAANGGLGTSFWRVGKKAAGRLLDGVEHNGMPA